MYWMLGLYFQTLHIHASKKQKKCIVGITLFLLLHSLSGWHIRFLGPLKWVKSNAWREKKSKIQCQQWSVQTPVPILILCWDFYVPKTRLQKLFQFSHVCNKANFRQTNLCVIYYFYTHDIVPSGHRGSRMHIIEQKTKNIAWMNEWYF